MIDCQNWRNPTQPIVVEGFHIKILDLLGAPVDSRSEPFDIDATAFTPFEIEDSSISLELSDDFTRKVSDYTFSIKSEVPLKTGVECSLTITLPEDFDMSQMNLDQIEGSGMLVG